MLESSLLWQVSGQIGSPSYLYGTMHVRDEVAYRHIEKAKRFLYKCQAMKLEMDLNEMQQIPSDTYLLPNGNGLTDYLPESKYIKLMSILKKAYDFDLAAHSRLKPLLIINKISESILGKQHAQPLDAYLWQEGQRMNMKCSGLETVDEQIHVLQSIDIDLQIKMLKDVCRDVGKYRQSINNLKGLYEKEDIVALYQTTRKSLGSLRCILLHDRNKRMADRIGEAIDAEPTFYAIGAAHLSGYYGVLALLKRKNFKLTAIQNEIRD